MRTGDRYSKLWFSTRTVPVPLSLLFLAALPGGCMTLGDQVPPPAEARNSPSPEPSSAPQPLVTPQPRPSPTHTATAKAEKKYTHKARLPKTHKSPASIDPASLIGLEPAGVQKLLGAPAQVRRGGMSREWVYSAPGCSFRVFFYPSLKSALFHALKYGSSDRNGDAIDSSDICIRHILTARSDGPG